MFKDVWNTANLGILSEIAMVMFFLIFLGVLVWVFTRSRRQVDRWSKLPLQNEEPKSPNRE
jgi:cbb3-type cytochrome oxidase subunit 3